MDCGTRSSLCSSLSILLLVYVLFSLHRPLPTRRRARLCSPQATSSPLKGALSREVSEEETDGAQGSLPPNMSLWYVDDVCMKAI